MFTAVAAPDESEPVVAGDGDFRKFIHLKFEGNFNTIQTIVIPEDEWLALMGVSFDGGN